MKNSSFNKKSVQRRCCGVCGKHGHNKSTCSGFALRATPDKSGFALRDTPSESILEPAKIMPAKYSPALPTPNRGIGFFVHHVSGAPQTSAHVVNLKNTKTDVWEKVQAIAPEQDTNLYHHYHEIPTAPQPNFSVPVKKTIIITDEFDLPVLQQTDETVIAPKQSLIEQTIAFAPTPKKRDVLAADLKNYTNAKLNNLRANVKNLANNSLFWKRSAAIMTAVLIFGIAPIPAQQYARGLKFSVATVAENSLAGFSSLQKSVTSLFSANTAQAQTDLDSALTSFNLAVDTMQTKHRFLQTLARALPLVNTEFESRQNIILAGQNIALGNSHLLSAYNNSNATASTTLTDRLKTISIGLNSALPNYQSALELLKPVKENVLPEEYRAEFNKFKILFSALVGDLDNLSKLTDQLPEIFGGQGLRRYLLVFQNEHELRPTGGFMGSFALLEVKDGQIINIDVPPNGSYALRYTSDVYLEPPAPLLLINSRFEFQDSNWYPDFPANAQKALWFFRHSRGITADGVIAINSSVFEKLLKIIGPITDDNRQVVLAHDSALGTLQAIVETGAEKKEGRPKQIITDLTPKIIDAVLKPKTDQLLPILSGLQNSLKEKQIQAYFTDEKAQSAITEYGWGGEILPTDGNQDYLFVVNTNIHGEKSDARMIQTVSHEAKIDDVGTITNTVVITRTHTGTRGEKFYGVDNIDYLRIYVPAESELVSAQGFTWPEEEQFFAPTPGATIDTDLIKKEKEIKFDQRSGTRITEEFGKTAFGNWLITEPGQTTQATFIYHLPFKVNPAENGGLANYQLIVQKQSGINSTFDSQIITPDSVEPKWADGVGTILASNGVRVEPLTLDTNKIWSLVMKKR
ncbi:MAG: hypothetical protein A3J93_04755 [Candidatus Magasanikbacteria bacterium RIFOXYC2_FULL_42_28]|uniref:DUF4012 domain-containing protein n=1 Tax=Candidatus Magasanikbacteria bacterium RIFOXYC2_FULL_42_28 TaxID=1798704 RepID=A0A1F6NWN3_9BACT|nr:MAG: hypothetical protein A3J93_04755 [Candidatus Magasanikbacteria bacterium RIFOXYC2_FULL_42_28]